MTARPMPAPAAVPRRALGLPADAVQLIPTTDRAALTIENAPPFFLNNELTDFSFEPTRDGKPVEVKITLKRMI